MKFNFKHSIALVAFASIAQFANAQDDLLSLTEDPAAKAKHEKVFATFKGAKVINAQTTETVKKKTLDFCITHRFGNIGDASGGGAHTLYGLDNISDVRIGFSYGITDNLTLGWGRSKSKELIDVMAKFRFLTQTQDNHIPLSVAFYGDASYNPQVSGQFYNGAVFPADFKKNDLHRLSYVGQLIIARKFGSRFSIEILPTYQHRNFIVANINPDNGAVESNDLFAVGAAARLKLTKRICLVADYFYTFSKFRTGNSTTPYYNALAVGIEIETGGHVFHLNFTNATGIIENNFIPNTNDSWSKGGVKFGFNISRVFNIGKR
jgi:hypothetical protein